MGWMGWGTGRKGNSGASGLLARGGGGDLGLPPYPFLARLAGGVPGSPSGSGWLGTFSIGLLRMVTWGTGVSPDDLALTSLGSESTFSENAFAAAASVVNGGLDTSCGEASHSSSGPGSPSLADSIPSSAWVPKSASSSGVTIPSSSWTNSLLFLGILGTDSFRGNDWDICRVHSEGRGPRCRWTIGGAIAFFPHHNDDAWVAIWVPEMRQSQVHQCRLDPPRGSLCPQSGTGTDALSRGGYSPGLDWARELTVSARVPALYLLVGYLHSGCHRP
eukprot:1870145-Amphidinium_carterae.1